MEAATRAARANITLEEQIHQIHKVKGLLPDEEKEKIGPKQTGVTISAPPVKASPAVISAAAKTHHQIQQSPQSQMQKMVCLCFLNRMCFKNVILHNDLYNDKNIF